jgi:predicted nucleic acid-binding protein
LILDTNALSDFLAGQTDVIRLITAAPVALLPVVVLGEYRFGVERSTRRRVLLPRVDDAERLLRVLKIDATTARHYAGVRLALAKQGRPIPQNDLWIAALARQYDLPVLSRDHHFDYVPDLQRISW